MTRLRHPESARVCPWRSFATHLLNNPITKPFSVSLSSIVHEHKFVKLRILKNISIEPSAQLSYFITAPDVG